MKLRNGKRSLKEAKALFERHQRQRQELIEEELTGPSQVGQPSQPKRRTIDYHDIQGNSNLLKWGREMSEKSKLLEKRAQLMLARSDRQTSELYKLNRRLDTAFCKMMLEKTKKDTIRDKRGLKQNEAFVKQLEDELKVLREKHAKLVRQSKKSLLQAKRLFMASKRVAEGYVKTELEESCTRYRKGCKLHIGKDCSVCLDEISVKDRSVQVHQCQHVLHADCFDAWMELHTTCPVCRTRLEAQVDDFELPQQITDTISWADMTTTNVSAV